MWVYDFGFSYVKNMANFEGFCWVISSSINLLFLKSVLTFTMPELSRHAPINGTGWDCLFLMTVDRSPQLRYLCDVSYII